MRWLIAALAVSWISGSLWAEELAPKPDPKALTKSLQGDWVLLPHQATLGAKTKMISWVTHNGGFQHFKELGVKKAEDISYLRFEGSTLRLLHDLDGEVRIAVTVENSQRAEQGFCRIKFQIGSTEVLGACRVQGDKLEIRVSEGCVCPKSGNIAVFQRVGK